MSAKLKSRKVAWVVLGVVGVLLSAVLVLVGPTVALGILYEQWMPVHVAAGSPSGNYVWEGLDQDSAIQKSGWIPPPGSGPMFFKVRVPRWEWLPFTPLGVEIGADEYRKLRSEWLTERRTNR